MNHPEPKHPDMKEEQTKQTRREDPLHINVAARVTCTEAEGPGKRYALWVQGCPLRCPGCCNPHMLAFKTADLRTVEDVAAEILQAQKDEDIEGVTFIGGEPFAQAEGLTALAKQIRPEGLSVMVFTGFTLSKIQKEARPEWDAFLKEIDLLVDGPYIQSQLVTDRRWIGSANQKIRFLTERYAHLQDEQGGWDKGKNTIELRLKGNEIFINGFPHDDITKALEELARASLKAKTGAAE